MKSTIYTVSETAVQSALLRGKRARKAVNKSGFPDTAHRHKAAADGTCHGVRFQHQLLSASGTTRCPGPLVRPTFTASSLADGFLATA